MKVRDLEVYRRSFKAAVDICEVSKEWPKHELFNGLSDQIRRASRGICANLVEGLSKTGKLEQKRFLNIAIGSAREVQVWLEFAYAHKYIPRTYYEIMEQEFDEIVWMLVALVKRRESS